MEATAATSKVPVFPFPAQTHPQPQTLTELLVITAEQISKYAEISSLASRLKAQQETLRDQLLDLRAAGAEQEETAPYLLNFVDQERCNIDWKTQALTLAAKVYGSENVVSWREEVERADPVTEITQIRVKPNPLFAAGIASKKPAGSERRTQ